ncbi:hypothetical protein [Petrimonas sp.]|uniref:hypothetical protein n=1 Tax=Petrimonas sp. TaxID=2023866 RepID=UPI003F511A97
MVAIFARMGGIFFTVGDLFACGKEHYPNSAWSGGTCFGFKFVPLLWAKKWCLVHTVSYVRPSLCITVMKM